MLKKLSSLEPELQMMMGVQPQLMGMDAIRFIASGETKSDSATKEADDSISTADAKFGQPHPQNDEELLACSGKVAKQIQRQEKRTEGTFLQVAFSTISHVRAGVECAMCGFYKGVTLCSYRENSFLT